MATMKLHLPDDEETSWLELLAYGRETGRASGYAEENVPDLVKQWRAEQRRQ
jgi:hypothetical protein